MQARERHARGSVLTLVVLTSILATGISDAADAAAKVVYAPPTAVVFSEASCESDWVEIQNTDPKLTANLANWMIADSMPANPAKSFHFPKTKLLKPGARIVVKAPVLPFKLGCGSDNVYLVRTKTVIVDQIAVPNLVSGFTWGRIDSVWQANLPTPAKSNQPAPPDAVVDKAAWMYSPLKSYQVKLTVDPAQLQKLVTAPKVYVPAKFQMQDDSGNLLPATGPLDVGLRVKGNFGSLTDPAYGEGGLNIVDDKVSLKVKFNFSVKDQTFFGLKKIVLNSMVQDRSMVHETLAYKLFRDSGIIAPRTGFANVYINDSLRGLFLNLEAYDDVFLAWHMPIVGHLYQGEAITVHPDISAAASSAFTVDEGDPKNTSDLQRLVAAVDKNPTFVTAVRDRLDVTELGTFMALEKFMNHWDGYSGSVPWAPNNIFIVSDGHGRFQFLPWGTDTTWRFLPLMEGLDEHGGERFDFAVGVMFSRCMADDVCASAYRRTLARAITLAPEYQALATSLMQTHAAARIADTVRITTEEQVLWAVDELALFFTQRPVDAQQYLDKVVTGKLRWTPATLKMAKGTALSAAQLNAYSDVLGTFAYSVPLGTVLPVGQTAVTVTFTPTDPKFETQTASTTFSVG